MASFLEKPILVEHYGLNLSPPFTTSHSLINALWYVASEYVAYIANAMDQSDQAQGVCFRYESIMECKKMYEGRLKLGHHAMANV